MDGKAVGECAENEKDRLRRAAEPVQCAQILRPVCGTARSFPGRAGYFDGFLRIYISLPFVPSVLSMRESKPASDLTKSLSLR